MFNDFADKAFLVGGAVRNELMGIPPKDLDFVVEATEEEFAKIFPDAKRVGNTFPVFLIEDFEVALTRKEKSTGNAYQDFELEAVGVPIHDDLARRDFSINSIARNVKTGELVDPFNGANDIKERLIRTINDSFVKEDPLRVFRAARFMAEFDFNIDKHTVEIIRRDRAFVKNVLPERIFAEVKKMFERSNQPSIFFRVLHHFGVLKIHFPELHVATKRMAGPFEWHGNNTVFDHLMESLDIAKAKNFPFHVAMAAMMHDFGKVITPRKILPKHIMHEVRGEKLHKAFFKRHRFDADTMELAIFAGKNHMKMHHITEMKPIKLIRFFREIPKKFFEDFINVCDCDSPLSDKQKEVIEKVKRALKETKIDIPKEVHKKGRVFIKEFVDKEFTKTFVGLNK